MSRLLPRLLADKEYFEMSQGLLEFRLQSDLASTQKNKMEKYHLGVRVEKNTLKRRPCTFGRSLWYTNCQVNF